MKSSFIVLSSFLLMGASSCDPTEHPTCEYIVHLEMDMSANSSLEKKKVSRTIEALLEKKGFRKGNNPESSVDFSLKTSSNYYNDTWRTRRKGYYDSYRCTLRYEFFDPMGSWSPTIGTELNTHLFSTSSPSASSLAEAFDNCDNLILSWIAELADDLGECVLPGAEEEAELSEPKFDG